MSSKQSARVYTPPRGSRRSAAIGQADTFMGIFGFKRAAQWWVIREGSKRGKGRYWMPDGLWSKRQRKAQPWASLKPETLAELVGGRVVRVRKLG